MSKIRLELGAELDILNGEELSRALRENDRWQWQAAFGMRHQDLPRMIGSASAAGVLALGADQPDQVFCGPKEGQVWTVTRIAVDGLSGGAQVESTPANPAPGAGFVYTVPAGPPLTLLSAFFKYVASATAGNRFVNITIADANSNTIAIISNNTATTAGLTTSLTAAQGIGQVTSTGAAEAPIPEALLLQPGWTVTFSATGILAGDQVQNIAFVTAAGPDVVKVYKEAKFIGDVNANPGYITLGKGHCVLTPGEYLRVTGTIAATGQIEVYGEALTAPAPMQWKIIA